MRADNKPREAAAAAGCCTAYINRARTGSTQRSAIHLAQNIRNVESGT